MLRRLAYKLKLAWVTWHSKDLTFVVHLHLHVSSFQVIAEGANGPTTPAAEKVLIENNKLVIPVSF